MGWPRTTAPAASEVKAASGSRENGKNVAEPPSPSGDCATSPKSEPGASHPSKRGETATASPGDGGNEKADKDNDPAENDQDEASRGGPISTDDDNKEEASLSPSSAPAKKVKLYKSPRFKGYLTIVLASAINYHNTNISQESSDLAAVPASDKQRFYGMSVAMVSALISGFCVLCHLDGFSCLRDTWRGQLFAPRSRFEVILDLFLLLWWAIATIVQTGVRGIAGDGKEQYNLYYSIWCCLYASVWTMESKMTEYEWPTIKAFVKSWPYRAPGWIAIFVFDFFTLFWYVDLYINTAQYPDRVSPQLEPFYSEIPKSQYEWLIFVASATLLPSGAFIFVEIFRDSSKDEKPAMESYAEGICLLMLTIAWIPSVIVATTPGGFASVIGNSYFFTWATTIFVMETAMWFVHDSRAYVHQTLVQKEEEYKQHQQMVLEQTREIQAEAEKSRAQSGIIEQEEEEDWPRLSTFANGRRMTGDDSANSKNMAMFAGETDSMDGDPMTFKDINQTGGAGNFDLQPASDDDDNLDDSIRQEIQMKEANRRAYFDTLDDILE